MSAETFEQVQRVLVNHRQPGERSSRHHQYLTGTVHCGRCRSRLQYGVSRGRTRETYAYYFCAGRHSVGNGCQLPYLRLEAVEHAVTQQWQVEVLKGEFAADLDCQLLVSIGKYNANMSHDRQRLTKRLESMKRERTSGPTWPCSGQCRLTSPPKSSDSSATSCSPPSQPSSASPAITRTTGHWRQPSWRWPVTAATPTQFPGRRAAATTTRHGSSGWRLTPMMTP